MTYDLRRLRLKGLIHRIPGTTRYTATTYGLHVEAQAPLRWLPLTYPNPFAHVLFSCASLVQLVARAW